MLRVLLMTSLLVLSGCAATLAPPEQSHELRPGEAVEILSPNRYFFAFTLQEPTRVVIESETFPGFAGYVSPRAIVTDGEGTVVARDWSSGHRSNFRIDEEFPAGTWYLRVDDPFACRGVIQCEDREYQYTVTLKAEPQDATP